MKKRLNGILTLFLAFVVQLTFAQQKTVTGTVIDEQGLPLPGVNVIVQGTNSGTQTDFDGNYVITVEQGQTLVFSYVGYATLTREVGQANMIDVTLAEDAAALDEVVVVGYGTTTKQSFTGTAKTVSGELLERKNVANISQALAGESAGVQVINTSGQPGTSATIRIRGIGSVNGNRAPLYVLDGVPYTGNINAINPSDIESTTILKDAAATAIYGARGANGVVVLNTKKGRQGRSEIEIETRTGTNAQLLPRYDVMTDPEQFIGLTWEGMYNRGVASGQADPVAFANARLFSNSGIRPHYNMWNVADGGELIDPETRTVRPGVTRRYTPERWEDFAFQTSRRNETNLKISGANESTSYYTSFGYLSDEGYSINSDFERYSARLNVTHEVNDWLSGSMNVGYSVSDTNNAGQTSDSGSVFWFVDGIPPIYPLFLRDSDGNILEDPFFNGNQYDYGEAGRGFGALTNSIADANFNIRNTMRHEINTNTFLKARFSSNFSFETRFGTQYYNSSYDSQNNPFYGSAAGQNGSIFKSKTEVLSYNWLKLFRYTGSAGDHSVDAFVAHENNSWERKYLSGNMWNLADPTGREWNNAIENSRPSSYIRDYTLESYFGQVNYDYNDTYFLSGTIRRDGSSRFLQDKWGTFGSVGAAWVMSNENFMRDLGVFDFFKLKASYGLIGDQAGVGYYPGYDLFTVENLDGNISLAFDTKGNPDLTWETSKMFQTGIEFSLGRYFDANIDYYRKQTDDLIFDRRVGPSLGYALIQVNDGALMNQGIEFDLTAHLLKGQDYWLDLTVNGEHVRNELIRMPIEPATGEEKIIDISGLYGRSVGRSLFDFYTREYAGVDPATGDGMWYMHTYQGEIISSLAEYLAEFPERAGQIDIETTNNYQDATLKYLDKDAFPTVRGAFNLSAGFKGFTFGAQFLYSLGGYAYDGQYAGYMRNNPAGGNNWHMDILDRWQQPGDITSVPKLSDNYDNQNTHSGQSRFVTSSDYLALNNVRLGYNVPARFVESFGMRNLNIWLAGDNLFLLSAREGFNPSTAESGASSMYRYSPLSTFTAGVRVNF